MQKLAYKLGVGLVIISFLISVYNFYLLIYTIPTFVLGIILVWGFGSSLTYKLTFTFAPILLFAPCSAAFLYLYNYSPTKLMLLPPDHVGKFRIIYDEPCGHTYDLNDDMKTIKISETGLTIMKEEFDGKLNFKYQFIGGDREIPVILDVSDTSKYDIAILGEAAGVHYISTAMNNNDINEVDFRYSDFYLYKKGLENNWSNETIDSLTEQSIRNCRNQFNLKNEH